MRSILAAAVGLAFLSLPAASLADEARIAYVERPIGNAEVSHLWSDVASFAKQLGGYSPWVLVARKDIGDGRVLTISQLWAGGICSNTACPLRVHEGNELLASELACSEPEHHQISEDGRLIVACDTVIRTNRK